MKQPVGLNRTGIALDVDKKYKFKNPSLEKFGTLEAGTDFKKFIHCYWESGFLFFSDSL